MGEPEPNLRAVEPAPLGEEQAGHAAPVIKSPVAFTILVRMHTDGNITWSRPDGVDDMLMRRVLLGLLDYTQIDMIASLAATKVCEFQEHDRVKRMLTAAGPEGSPFQWKDGRR